MKFLHICLVCLAVIATGEEHNHAEEEHNHTEVEDDHDHHQVNHLEHDHHSDLMLGHDNHGQRLPGTEDNPVHDYQTWLAALGSTLLISLCGIFGILVIPIMQRVFYQHLIQFLIAMVVGTLAGDALLHLLPHAFRARITAGM